MLLRGLPHEHVMASLLVQSCWYSSCEKVRHLRLMTDSDLATFTLVATTRTHGAVR